MNINKFIEKIAEQFEETDSSEIGPDTKFRELDEWSSMLALIVIAMADEEFDKELTGSEIRNSETFQDLFNVLNEK